MKLTNTALFMILWLLCQQAVLASVALSVDASGSNAEFDPSCHENAMTGLNSDKMLTAMPDHNSEVSADLLESHEFGGDSPGHHDQKCCELECSCCIGGCLSLMSGANGSADNIFSSRSVALYSTVFPQTRVDSLFRPPIFH